MAMDAGKFPNFNIGGLPPQARKIAPSGPKETPSVQHDPTESVQLGAQPLANANIDAVSPGISEPKAQVPQFSAPSYTSAIPAQVGDFLIAGPSSISSGSNARVSFEGITALNGLSSTSLQSLGGSTVASVNPLSPKTASKLPSTSADLVVSSFEDTQWLTTSGRTISL